MKQLTEKEIRDFLTPRERPEPPAGLAERIKSEIPDELVFAAPEPQGHDSQARPTASRSRFWLMAASVVVAVGGSLLALRLMERTGMESAQPAVAEASRPAVIDPTAAGSAPSDQADQRPARQARGDAAPGVDRDTGAGDEMARRLEESVPSAATDREDTASLTGQLKSRPVEPPAPALERGASSRGSQASDEDLIRSPAERQERLRQLPQSLSEAVPVAPGARSSPPPERPDGRARAREPSVEESIEVIAELPVFETTVSAVSSAIETAATKAPSFSVSGTVVETAKLPAESPPPAPSTGGTAEPNDAPYGDVFFRDAGTNPFIDTEDDALSTFGLDVDTASYTVARRYITDGHLPPREAVRVEEFINYFDYGDAAPTEGDFAIHAEGAPSIYGEGERYYLLRFNLSGREVASEDRRPALLTFVVDVSGSMQRENRLGLVQRALALLLDQLRADDRMALVIYGSRGQVLIEPTSDRDAIRRGIEQLRTGGSTNAEEGLALAYELAARHRRPGTINRVILCSDGVANTGATSAGSILDRIRSHADQGIELTTVGFGMGNYNDVLMERLADEGNGRYAYVDTLDEARRIFVENLTGTLQTLAAEARTQVEFNPRVVSRYRLLGYENRDIADEKFRDDTVDAGEIGVGHSVTALYEIKLHRRPRPRDEVATLRLRYGSIARGETVELAREVTGADFTRRFNDASPALRLTALVAEFGEVLKRSYWAREGDLEDVFRRAQKVSAELAGNHDVADFVSLVGRASEAWQRQAAR